MKFNVRFTISRFPLRNMYRAIENVGQGFLFPQPKEDMEENTDEITIKSFFNRDIEKNYEQKLAVSFILHTISTSIRHRRLIKISGVFRWWGIDIFLIFAKKSGGLIKSGVLLTQIR